MNLFLNLKFRDIQVQSQKHKSKSNFWVPISYVSSGVYSVSLICHKIIFGHIKTHFDLLLLRDLLRASLFEFHAIWVWPNFSILLWQLFPMYRQSSEVIFGMICQGTGQIGHTSRIAFWYKLTPRNNCTLRILNVLSIVTPTDLSWFSY